MRSKIKQKKVRNETLPLPLLRKHKKTKQAELYTVTESQNENYILQNREKRGIKLEGKRSRPIYQLKHTVRRFVLSIFVAQTLYQRCSYFEVSIITFS